MTTVPLGQFLWVQILLVSNCTFSVFTKEHNKCLRMHVFITFLIWQQKKTEVVNMYFAALRFCYCSVTLPFWWHLYFYICSRHDGANGLSRRGFGCLEVTDQQIKTRSLYKICKLIVKEICLV